jgi:precorrin-8X/cobalt-precorrin-8 methylmutase
MPQPAVWRPAILDPQAIEAESFRIIEREIGPHAFTPEQFKLAQRAIHATADFDFAKNLVFHPNAIESGVAALKAGCDVVVDVQMIQAGVSLPILNRLGKGKLICAISDEDVIRDAKAAGVTRAIMAMRKHVKGSPGAVYAIGNAPTALLELLRLVIEEKAPPPALVIGVPVGFVSAAESKEALVSAPFPFVAARGRKGGSTVAVAMLNALLRLADAKA